MRKLLIPLINIIIILAVSIGIIAYVNNEQRNSKKVAQETFIGSTDLICAIADVYLADIKGMCSELANYISGDKMTMQGALTFLNGAKVSDDTTVHIIWTDDYTGLSREAKNTSKRDYHVDYSANTRIFDGWTNRSNTYITPRYVSPTSGEYVIAVCEKIRLYEKGKRREAILMRVIPIDYLETKWVFPTDYENIYISVIDNDGEYVFNPSNVHDDDFYNYICSCNKDGAEYDKLKTAMVSSNSGYFNARDVRQVRRLWCYKRLAVNSEWMIVVSVPESEIYGESVDWFIPTLILVTLLLIFVIDIAYLGVLRNHEKRVTLRLEEQGRQLQAALDKADEANRAKTVFLNNMSHDIRTPMNAIIGFTTLATTHIDQKELVSNYLSKIMTASEHLLSLINDVLDMSRIEAGKLQISEQDNSIAQIVSELKDIMQADIEKNNLTLTIDMDSVEHDGIVCDRLRLNQVLINLMSNAMKFTNSGGRVGLRIVEKKSEKEGVADFEFLVSDSGIGMSEEFAKHIFEPFTREESSTSSGIQGTGLGMAITKKIVDMMNGTITVKSKQGEGTEVTVGLCFKISDGVVSELTATSNCDKTNESLEGKRILLVDDVELNREIAIAILEEAGAIVETGTNGKEALEIVANSKPGYFDLILMDVMMPVMDGYEATRNIRNLDNKKLANIPIIAMTANAFEEDKRVAIEAGMNNHIAKPFQINKLYEMVRLYF